MSRSMRLTLAALVATAAAGPAVGQVVRCVDPVTQNVTYTDGVCAAGEKSSMVTRKMTFAETLRQEREAAVAQQRIDREIAASRQRQLVEELAAPRPARAAGLNGPSGGGPSGSVGRADCERARRDLETRQSSIGRKKNDNDISALLSVAAGCGIDASKYIVDPPPRIQLERPGRYEVKIEDSRRR